MQNKTEKRKKEAKLHTKPNKFLTKYNKIFCKIYRNRVLYYKPVMCSKKCKNIMMFV